MRGRLLMLVAAARATAVVVGRGPVRKSTLGFLTAVGEKAFPTAAMSTRRCTAQSISKRSSLYSSCNCFLQPSNKRSRKRQRDVWGTPEGYNGNSISGILRATQTGRSLAKEEEEEEEEDEDLDDEIRRQRLLSKWRRASDWGDRLGIDLTNNPFGRSVAWWANSIFACWLLSVSSLDLFLPAFLVPSPLSLIIRLTHAPVILATVIMFMLFGSQPADSELVLRPRTRVRLNVSLVVWALAHGAATIRASRLGLLGWEGMYYFVLDLLALLVCLRSCFRAAAADGEAVRPQVLLSWSDYWGKLKELVHDVRDGEGLSIQVYAAMTLLLSCVGLLGLLIPQLILTSMFPSIDAKLRPFGGLVVRNFGASLLFEAVIANIVLKEAASSKQLRANGVSSTVLSLSFAGTALTKLIIIRWMGCVQGLGRLSSAASVTLNGSYGACLVLSMLNILIRDSFWGDVEKKLDVKLAEINRTRKPNRRR